MSAVKHFIRTIPMALITVGLASADIVATYDPAGQQMPDATLCAGATTCIVGVENFDSWSGGPFTTDFGTSGQITGSYSGNFQNFAADEYGGAGGVGGYPEIFSDTYTLQLSSASGVPGVNYFGLWYSALDNGNSLQFYSGDNLVYSFTPDAFSNLVGACPGVSAFCGNPNANFLGSDAEEQFAYLNFYDTNSFFDRIVFSEITDDGGFESDNHAVGYLDPVLPSGTVIAPLPEPTFMALTGAGFFALAGLAIRRRKTRTS